MRPSHNAAQCIRQSGSTRLFWQLAASRILKSRRTTKEAKVIRYLLIQYTVSVSRRQTGQRVYHGLAASSELSHPCYGCEIISQTQTYAVSLNFSPTLWTNPTFWNNREHCDVCEELQVLSVGMLVPEPDIGYERFD